MIRNNVSTNLVIFTAFVIIAATALGSVLVFSNFQIVMADQKAPPPRPPEPDCSIHTDDGRIIYVPCNPTPPVVDTTKTKSSLLNNDGTRDQPLQATSSSPITTNSVQSTDKGNANEESQDDTESMNAQSTAEQNDVDHKAIQLDNLQSARESSDEKNPNDLESSEFSR